MALQLDDTRWYSGSLEPFTLVNNVNQPFKSLPDLTLSDTLNCTTCRVNVGNDRFSLVMHYRSGWHRYNLRRKIRGKPIISEEIFEETISDTAELNDSSLSESDDEEVPLPFSEGVEEYFVHEGNVFSVYKSILFKEEHVSRSLFIRPLNCAIFILSGGHFSGGIFINNQLIIHKSFHRYTVRAKQGGVQSARDSKNGVAKKSAGANLRRYNEKALSQDIRGFLENSSNIIDECPLIFIRVPIYNRSLFISDSLEVSPFLKSDKRLRTIPFPTYRPSIDELMRVWKRLKRVSEHGKVDDVRKAFEEKRNLKIKKISLRRSRQSHKVGSSSNIADNSKEVCTRAKEKQTNGNDFCNLAEEISERVDEADPLTEEQKQTIYLAIRTDCLEDLRDIINRNSDKREKIIEYLNNAHFPPDHSSFLHLSAKRDARFVLKELLQLGCDPCIKDASGLVPFEVANSKLIKRVFIEHRSANPELWNWNCARIPEMKKINEEKLKKDAEKKKLQKERRKLREKAKKEEERLEKEQQAERNVFLSLSDREKRALAAERRMGIEMQKTSQIVPEDGNRCFQCGRILPSVPFEYSNNRFCQISCVKEHRQANQKLITK